MTTDPSQLSPPITSSGADASVPIVHELLFIKRESYYMVLIREGDHYSLIRRHSRKAVSETSWKRFLRYSAQDKAQAYFNLRQSGTNKHSWAPATKDEIIKSHYLAFPHIKPENPDV